MQTILVTGANRGIGLALAEKLLSRGDRVVATARDPAGADALATLLGGSDGRGILVALDVADERSIARALKEVAAAVDGIDGLVNNAGTNGGASGRESQLGKLSLAALDEVFRVNAAGALLVTQASLELLRRGTKPRILNVSSVMGSIAETTSGGSYAYRMSKAALDMATKALANDLRPEGIAVRAVHPGWVQTRMGGSGAPVKVEQSAQGLVRILDDTRLENSGTFVTYEGKPCPW